MSETRAIRIPPRGTKGTRMPGGKALMRLFKPMMDMQTNRYKRAKDGEPMKFMGFPVVLLTTIGAKTGKEHTHPLGGFPDGDDAWLVIASKSGSATHPQWFINLAKNTDQVWLQVGNRRWRVDVESLQGAERDTAYARVVAEAPTYGKYQQKTDREIPVLRLTRAE